MKNRLASVINTLNEIEVRGKDNLDMLLGCILTLETLAEEDTTEVVDDGRQSD